MIAASVVVVGGLVVGQWAGADRGVPETWLAAGAGAFGLVHGLGLAYRFSVLGIEQDVLAKVILFNVGIETGQLIAIAAMVGLGALLGVNRPERRQGLVVPLGYGVLGGGMLALAVTAYLALFPRVGDTVDLTLPAGSTCSVEINTDPLPTGALGDPPLQGFWEPTETTPIRTFEHARTDGSLTIYYPRSAGSTELAAIESLALSAEGRGILAGSASQQQVDYRFKTFHEVLVCTEFEEETMRRFAQAWFATL